VSTKIYSITQFPVIKTVMTIALTVKTVSLNEPTGLRNTQKQFSALPFF